MAAHLKQEGLKEAIKKLNPAKKPESKEEIADEWKRMASFMGGQR